MRAFLSRNRQFDNAPQLVFEHERLDRQVQIRQDVDQTLRREFEAVRIDQVNDTPVLTVASTRPDLRGSRSSREGEVNRRDMRNGSKLQHCR